VRSLSFIELLSAMWLQSQNAGQGEGLVEARDRTADNFRTTHRSSANAAKTEIRGLLVALRAFLKVNPESSVIYHTQVNHGLTVISRD